MASLDRPIPTPRQLPVDDWRDVVEGVAGAAIMVLCLVTPFLRRRRSHWGMPAANADRDYPGDDLMPSPTWGWTHGIDIRASAEQVWPWLSQMGADKGGFYSYQWLENVAGCGLSNAEAVHPDWEVRQGETFVLHPQMPGPTVVAVERGRYFLVHAAPDAPAKGERKRSPTMTWLFFLEELGPNRCRAVSRYRIQVPEDLTSRLALGPTLIEPIGFAMDRRMLMGIKARVERAATAA